ncbi:hypothetical protein SHKM778_51050 [Streptomyces sp. KM77-8]|uniref:Nucleotidyltransferase family protein n=1 Tax=Streptomyces haneummycinicus TaxID=3074435 RepID=A0AAT9HMS3_9ACTN
MFDVGATTSLRGMSTPPTSDVDLFADDVVIDPYPVHAELREQGPVVHLPGTTSTR